MLLEYAIKNGAFKKIKSNFVLILETLPKVKPMISAYVFLDLTKLLSEHIFNSTHLTLSEIIACNSLNASRSIYRVNHLKRDKFLSRNKAFYRKMSYKSCLILSDA